MLRSSVLTWLSLASGVMTQGDLAGFLATQPELSTLLDLVTLAGLNETLSTSSNITVVAPTNAAFDALLEMDIPESTAIRNRNVTSVTALLDNHVWRGYYPSLSVTEVPAFVQSFVTPDQRNDIQPFTSITGGQYNGIVRNGDGVTLISGELSVSNVITPDIALGDGIIIHVIDAALMFGAPLELYLARAQHTGLNGALTTLQQGDANFTLGIDGANTGASSVTDITVFVPIDSAFESIASVLEAADGETLSDVLRYHFLNDSIVFSPSLANVSAPSLQGSDLTFTVFDDGSIFVNDAKIIFPNVILSNGVAHVIDSVLNPSNASIDRTTLDPLAPPTERVQFAGATSASSLPFTTFTFTEAAAESYTTPPLLSTYLPVAVPPGSGNATQTTSNTGTGVSASQTSVTPFTGAAAVAHPCVTGLAAIAGGIFLAALSGLVA